MNQEIFSPDDLDQFQFSPSDRNSERTQRTSTQPIAAYASSLSESLKSLSIVQEAKKAKTRKGIPNVTYYLSSSHSTLEEAQSVVAAEGGWRCKQGRNSAKGSKKFQKSIVFLCKKVGAREKMYLKLRRREDHEVLKKKIQQ